MTINPDRPVEELTGLNRAIVRQRLGNIHCMSSLLEQARHARPKNMRGVPVELRRGWVKCVIDTMAEYQDTFVAVTTGRL